MPSPLYSFEKRLFQGRRFRLTGNQPASVETQPGIDTAPLYASVALDVQIRDLKDRLFTYKVPEHFKPDAFVGAQVLVPFGAQGLVAGYIVSLTHAPELYRDGNVSFKEISDILVPEPAFDANYVRLLHWIADFYLCNISDVIQAAIPSIAAPKTKRVLALNETAFAVVPFEMQPFYRDKGARAVVEVLKESKSGILAVSAAKQRFQKKTKLSQGQFFKAITLLRQENVVSVSSQTEAGAQPKTQKCVAVGSGDAKTSRQKEVVAVLNSVGGRMPLKQLLEEARTTHGTIKKLADDGIVVLVEEELVRDPMAGIATVESKARGAITLTEQQEMVFQSLKQSLEDCLDGNIRRLERDTSKPGAELKSANSSPWLLHGVTGSGKTEIYIRLMEECLERGRSALLLVPEISLTPQLSRLLKTRFGGSVAVWHSALSQGERYDTWRRIKSGDVKVLLGARSAILVHMPDLGLIILDEEHDGSYKQSSPAPRYHAREIAEQRAEREGALLLLGSATPDVGTYRRAIEEERILELPERVFKQALPAVNIVDMRQEFSDGNRSIFSYVLAGAVQERLEANEQVILLINRRGYANHVFCRACGFVVRCKNCSVSLVYHQKLGQQEGYMACHHCAYTLAGLKLCPSCKGPFIKQYGLGTQRVEEEVLERFPDARVIRLDSDVAQTKGAHEALLSKFASGQADILIGTQMVAKGLDIERVTLVGVLAADAAFNMPDYRSMERGFQLLTQVSGRAGRGKHPGSVIFQSYNCDMPAIAWAQTHNYKMFAGSELESRELFQYPPFSQIIRVVIAGVDPVAAEAACDRLAEEIGHQLEETIGLNDVKILGPAPCIIERLRNKFRFHLIIKNLAGEDGRKLIGNYLRAKRMPADLQMAVDVGALDLL